MVDPESRGGGDFAQSTLGIKIGQVPGKIQDPRSGIHGFELQGEELRFELERAQSRFSA